jgi:ribonuclease H2 subunit B
MTRESLNPIKLLVLPKRSQESNAQIVTLPHPNGSKVVFLFDGKELFQLQKFASEFSSLAVDDFIVEEGSITAATPFDPIFILIPILEQQRVCRIYDRCSRLCPKC